MGGWHLSHVARKFERLLEAYRREDGGDWSGVELERATGSVVTRSYVTNLRKGRIENVGYEKMGALARAMGFPPEAWFKAIPASGERTAPEEGEDLAGRARHLFGAVRHPKTGESYTSAEVERMSAGELTEDEVEKIRTGVISDPPYEPGGGARGGVRRAALVPAGLGQGPLGPRRGGAGRPYGRDRDSETSPHPASTRTNEDAASAHPNRILFSRATMVAPSLTVTV
jgi:transcriptional regulator with XRE-family HTH domain